MIRMRTLTRRGSAVSLVIVGSVYVSGCSVPEPPGYAGEPTASGEMLTVEGVVGEEVAWGTPVRAWARDDLLVITTIGSGSCPLVPELEKVDPERQRITISTSVPGKDGPCTADSVPRTFEFDAGGDLRGYTVEVTLR